MASSKAATVPEYLAELPADRRKEIAAARALVRKGKSCLHFKRFDDLVPEAVATVVASTTPAAYIKAYEASRRTPAKRR